VNPRGSVEFEGSALSMFAGLLGMVLDRPVYRQDGHYGSIRDTPRVFPRRFSHAPTSHG
jgi:hypothetical protein